MDASEEKILSNELSNYRPRRRHRYSAVNVLLVRWREDDIGVAVEVDELARLLCEYSFLVWPYQIPSENSQAQLQLQVAQLIQHCGSEGNLIIVYYSGHGGRTADRMSSECVWSAKNSGGPWLDWAIIQPLFLGVSCDVAIILDCCFAGQAVRSRPQNHVEFLAATDKDQFTPTGRLPNRPSFTSILIQELTSVLREEGQITISELHHRMLRKETGLVKQPFYAVLSKNSSGGGIRIAKWTPSDVQTMELGSSVSSHRHTASLCLQIYLFHPLDHAKRETLLRWLTRESPSDIEHIEVVKQVVSEAQAVRGISSEILYPKAMGSSERTLLPTTIDAQEEARRLTRALTDVLTIPETYFFAELDVPQIIKSISEKSEQLLSFMTDCLATSSRESLSSLEELRKKDLFGTQDLASKIAMRLTIMQGEVTQEKIKVYFDQIAPNDQQLWIGKKDGAVVLVEYWQYEKISNQDTANNLKQAARTSALLSEQKSPAFRILPGLGYIHEGIRKRIGFVYQFPPGLATDRYSTLSDLITTVTHVPLDVRRRLASAICDSVLHLHSIGWFHKAIKSANIIVFPNADRRVEEEGEEGAGDQRQQPKDFENFYLIGFDCSRPSDAETWSSVDFSMQSNIYRHPDRWGKPKTFKQHHDLYALGILLLEIGCWRTLPSMDSSHKDFESITKPEKLRSILLEAVRTNLAHAAGSKYSDAVELLLSHHDWKSDEPWQIQRLVRQKVWQPLATTSM